MKKLDLLKKGESPTLLDTEKGNELIKAVNSLLGLTVYPSGLGEFKFTEGRSMLLLKIPKGEAAAAAEGPHPWKISKAASEAEGSIDLSIHPGTVSSILPENILAGLTVSSSGTFYIKLKCESDGKTINAVTVVSESSADSTSPLVASNGAPDTVYITIGIIIDGSIFQIETDVIEISPVVAFIESRVPPSLGAEPFIRWWRWGRSK